MEGPREPTKAMGAQRDRIPRCKRSSPVFDVSLLLALSGRAVVFTNFIRSFLSYGPSRGSKYHSFINPLSCAPCDDVLRGF